jgi:hypothetical protein
MTEHNAPITQTTHAGATAGTLDGERSDAVGATGSLGLITTSAAGAALLVGAGVATHTAAAAFAGVVAGTGSTALPLMVPVLAAALVVIAVIAVLAGLVTGKTVPLRLAGWTLPVALATTAGVAFVAGVGTPFIAVASAVGVLAAWPMTLVLRRHSS